MKDSTDNGIKRLLETENEQLKKFNLIVEDSVREKRLLTHKLHAKTWRTLRWSERLADSIASFGGSWRFIILFLAAAVFWMLLNYFEMFGLRFDPYPFILLNLALSMIAALQAPFIMMSQNRQEAQDRKRMEHDYLINLKAELEIRILHQKVDLVLMENIKILLESQRHQLELLNDLTKKVFKDSDC